MFSSLKISFVDIIANHKPSIVDSDQYETIIIKMHRRKGVQIGVVKQHAVDSVVDKPGALEDIKEAVGFVLQNYSSPPCPPPHSSPPPCSGPSSASGDRGTGSRAGNCGDDDCDVIIVNNDDDDNDDNNDNDCDIIVIDDSQDDSGSVAQSPVNGGSIAQSPVNSGSVDQSPVDRARAASAQDARHGKTQICGKGWVLSYF